MKAASSLLIAGVMAAAVLWNIGLHTVFAPELRNPVEYVHQGVPMPTAADSYYYLSLAETRGGTHGPWLRPPGTQPPAFTPPLCTLASGLSVFTGYPLGLVAYYLPLALSCLTIMVLCLWGNLLAGPAAGLFAGLFSTTSYLWYVRTNPGWFDTDCLNLFFPLLAGLLLTRAVLERTAYRYLYAVGCFACVGAFLAWWPQGGLSLAGLVVLTFATSFWMDSPKPERWLKIGLLAAGAVGLAVLATGGHVFLPEPFRSLGEYGASHLRLITKLDAGQLGAEAAGVARSISELEPMRLIHLTQDMGGNAILLGVALAGLVGMVIARPKRSHLFIVQFLVLGVLALFARRFSLFLMPLYAVGLMFAAFGLPWMLPALARRVPEARRTLVSALLAIAFLVPGVAHVTASANQPLFNSGQAALAEVIAARTEPNALVWSFWDLGYFLQYYGKRQTVIDGGSQDPVRTMMACLPLVAQTPTQARNFLRFFAAEDIRGVTELSAATGGQQKAVNLLRKVFAYPEKAEEILQAYGLDQSWQERLFPLHTRPVYLYLPSDIILRNWWYAYGTALDERRASDPPSTKVLQRADTKVDTLAGTITTADGYQVSLASMAVMTRDSLRQVPGTPDGQMVGLVFQGAAEVLLVDRPMFETLACQLLFSSPKGMPYFEPLAYTPFIGGVWRVR